MFPDIDLSIHQPELLILGHRVVPAHRILPVQLRVANISHASLSIRVEVQETIREISLKPRLSSR